VKLIYVCRIKIKPDQNKRGLKAVPAGKKQIGETTNMLDIVAGRQLADKGISI
jgi:hypothetical protein